MKLSVDKLPVFAVEATRLSIAKANTKWSDMTVSQVEQLTRLWFFECLLETQRPPEATPMFLTRQDACDALGCTLPTLEKLARNGSIKYRLLGNKKVFLQEDLASALMDRNQKTEK